MGLTVPAKASTTTNDSSVAGPTVKDALETLQSGAGNTFEAKTITLNAAGTIATGGVLSNPGANPTITITTTKRLKLWQGVAYPPAASDVYSDGKSNGTIQYCIANQPGASAFWDDVNCISIFDLISDGWSGLISDIRATEFDITFTKQGAGLDISAKMQLIEG